MDLKIDYAALADDDLRTVIAEATVELDRRRALAETPNLIAALYQLIEDAGGDTKQAEAAIIAAIDAVYVKPQQVEAERAESAIKG